MAIKRLGIHFAPDSLKLVEAEQQADKLNVINYSIDYFSAEAPADSAVKTLIASIRKNKIHAREVNLTLLGNDVVYKLIELPQMQEKEIASAIKYKLKTALPASFKGIGEIVVDYYKTQNLQHPDKQVYFVAAAPKEKVLGAGEVIKASGLILKDIVAPCCALKNALNVAGLEPYGVVYLGKHASLIILVKQDQVVFAREVKMGGEDITRAMVGVVQTEQGRLELDEKQAEEIKSKFGITPELLALMRPALEKISTEILNTFDYYRTEIGDVTEFKKVYFSGGASRTKNMIEYFRLQLGIEVELAPIKAQSAMKEFLSDAPILCLALGALVPGKDHLSLIPRKGELLSAVLKPIFLGLIFLLTLMLVYGWLYFQSEKLTAAHKSLQKEHQTRLAEIGKKAEETKGMVDLLKYSPKDRFTLVMQELSAHTPAVIYFKNLNYDNNTSQLIINGIVLEDHGKRSMANFIETLKQTRYFKSVNLVYLQESEAYAVPVFDFELSCILAGEAKK